MGLLKGIDPLLSADLLHILRSMGHGDKLCIVDCNFPAASIAKQTSSQKHVMISVPLPQALDAICSVLPLDHFVTCPAFYMCPQDAAAHIDSVDNDTDIDVDTDAMDKLPVEGVEVITEAKKVILKHSGVHTMPMKRFDFYEEAKTCFAVVQTMERRPYGNIIFVKGCVGPDGKDLKP
mmetsp:Transcript_15565/g.19757  ORF Transcript_15565/g.19757 Transcript_15565/m.19757 type:complete len:178 (-) Transcript_15565:122-655(-)|eukprot:CAMPEP_0203675538 /NCGR_PEP_ID=MMETSP0090-20130426/21072_1 /ASSEMBLY_ACC=CAM_ASM_001088 /TAXON_ID=426623 /ORGANISM="Chaetoceros affinis, Strain CCMP159" /LENGTH=177 /DNA_ID=CAMNT_0050541767 /DNA_START=24 /DNA_END=557 /DNA_ORIENTATION=+